MRINICTVNGTSISQVLIHLVGSSPMFTEILKKKNLALLNILQIKSSKPDAI
jgi:hypothetical protein